MSFELYKFQGKAINELRSAIARRYRHLLLQAPTGAGKTVIAADIVKRATDKGRRVMFLAHRRELVNQCADKLLNFGVDHGLLMAGEFPYGAADCQVASIDTLRARCITTNKMPLPQADVIIIDECHRSLAPTYIKIIESYPDAVVLGLTATPIRGDGKGLGHVYDYMVKCPSIMELIKLGHLVMPRTFAPTIPDLTGVRKQAGDWHPSDLERAMNHRRLVGDIVTHWHRLASDRPTVVFASGVKHSINLKDEFVRQGVRAAHVDGDTPLADRAELIDDLKKGNIQVVCNYGVLTEGFDEPTLSACVLARPTKHLGLYLQMAGRTLRPADKKKDSLIIDHSGNVYEHGFVTDDHDWALEEGKALHSDTAERQRVFDEKQPITCVMCTAVYTGQLPCPKCGHVPEKKGRYVETLHGELTEVRIEKRRTAKKRTYTMEEKQDWYSQLMWYALDKKKNKGWIAHTYRAKFGVWPQGIIEISKEPTKEVLGYIRHRNIAYAREMEKENASTNNQATG
jgi:superfamily II DNA or RNA helicase